LSLSNWLDFWTIPASPILCSKKGKRKGEKGGEGRGGGERGGIDSRTLAGFSVLNLSAYNLIPGEKKKKKGEGGRKRDN